MSPRRLPGKGREGEWRDLAKIFLLLKTAIFVTIALGFFWLPFNAANYAANFSYPSGETAGFSTRFKTWDAQHYLFLAEQGYHPGQQSNAFYPLFPFLIRTFQPLFCGQSLLSGLVLSNLFSLVALIYFYLLVKGQYGTETARLSCVFFLAFPTAFYLDLVYAESLFLALAIGFFYYLEEGKAAQAALFAFLLPLTKPIGILILVPALVFLFFNPKSHGRPLGSWVKVGISMAFLAGFCSYLVLMGLWTRDFWAGFHAQAFFTSGYGVGQLLHPWDWFISNFIKINYVWMGFGTGLMDRIFFVFYLLVLALGYRLLDRPLLVYCLVLGLVPALSGDLASFSRYWIALFPLFIVLASRFKRQAGYILGISLPLQAVLALVHSLNDWVG